MPNTLDPQARLAFRKELRQAGVNARGMDDAALTAAVAELASTEPLAVEVADLAEHAELFTAKEKAQVDAAAERNKKRLADATTKRIDKRDADTAPALTDDTAAQLAALIAKLTKPAPVETPTAAVDEKTLIELIKKHATRTLEVKPSPDRDAIKIEGAHGSLGEVVALLDCDIMPYLLGPAGSGKTTLGAQAAEALDVPFFCTGSVLAPYELLGMRNATGEYMTTDLRRAYEGGGVFLFDEIDGCSPRALLAINKLLDSDCFAFPDGVTVQKHADFYGIAAANTAGNGATREYSGRAPLDGATLDRFLEVKIGYDAALELRVARAEYKAYGGKTPAVVDHWVARVIATRGALASLKSPALVTPRASKFGARLLARGVLSPAQIARASIIKSLPADMVKQLKKALPAYEY